MKTTKKIFNNRIMIVNNSLLIGLLLAISSVSAQDIHFSNYNQNSLFLNPALAGVFQGEHRASIHYRDQWRSVTAPYSTAAIAYDGKFMRNSDGCFGLGISMYTDNAGDSYIKTSQANLNISYVKKLSSDNSMSLGIQGGYASRSLDLTNATWGDQFNGDTFDNTLQSGEKFTRNKVGYFDLGAGLNLHHKGRFWNIDQGASLYHINPAKIEYLELSKDALKMRMNVHGKFKYKIQNTNLAIAPSYMYSRNSNINLLIGGMSFEFQLKEASKYTGYIQAASYNIGVFYRNNDAVVVSAGFEYSNHEVRVAYDANISHLSSYSNSFGGFELSYIFHTPSAKSSGASML